MKTFKNLNLAAFMCLALMFTLFQAKAAPELVQEPTESIYESFADTNINRTVIDVPDSISLEPYSLLEWWSFVYALLTPIAVWLFGSFWPSSTKRELATKAMSVAAVILILVLSFKGFTFATLSQAVVALIMQVFVYDKVYQPLGMNTAKKNDYTKE